MKHREQLGRTLARRGYFGASYQYALGAALSLNTMKNQASAYPTPASVRPHPARYAANGRIPDVEIINCLDTDSEAITIRGATATLLRQQATRLTPDERLAAFVMSLTVKGGAL